jgi:hypothetical protein
MSPMFHRSPDSPTSHRHEHRDRKAGRRAARVVALMALVLAPLQASLDGGTSAAASTSASAARASAKTPKVFVALKKNKVTTKQRARVKVVVAPRVAAKAQRMAFGRVQVVVKGGGKTRTVGATMADHRTVVALPRLPKGFYKVRASFLGNSALSQAKSKYKKLTVIRAGGGDSGPTGWPNASNTGVPAGVTLKTYTGSCTITSAVTIDSKTMNCSGGVTVRAAGVVIRNSKINGRIVVDTDTNQSWSLSLTDSEVNADGLGGVSAITNGNVSILRVNIHGGHNGLQCEEHASFCSVKDSWIHDQYLAAGSGDHLGGVASFGSSVSCKGSNASGVPACLELVHNSIVCDAAPTSQGGGCTGDVNLLPQYGPLNGAIIQDNFMGANAGAAFCTFGGAKQSYPATHIVYTGNVFERGSNNKCADYGPVTFFDSGATGNVWSGNTWDDGSAVKAMN